MSFPRSVVGRLYRRYLALTFAIKAKFGRPVAVTIDGRVRINLLPAGQIAQCLHAGPYEEIEGRLVSRYLRHGMTVIDIGANVGLYSLIADKLVGATGTVWAIEPSQGSFERLERNLTLNRAHRVRPVKIALSATDDQFAILVGDSGHLDGERYLLPEGDAMGNPDDTERVPTISLDTFARRHRLEKIDFIKMDVEGGEYQVFLGAREILASNPTLVMVFEYTREGCARAGITPDVIADLLARYGFSLYAWDHHKSAWQDNPAYILSQGNAWAAASSTTLPTLVR